MRDKIYTYLKSQKTGAASRELVEQVLKIKGTSPNISETLIRTATAGDHRFVVDENHLWRIIERGGTPLSEAGFVFLSLLTSDTVERSKTIVEISAQKPGNDKTTDRLHLFIKPASLAVSALCLPADLAQEMKEGVPEEKAMRSLIDFCGESVLVGYDIQSSLPLLNKILNTLNNPLENAYICLKSLTKRLIPDLHPKSLHDIASFFQLPVMDIRRTEKEIGAIADIFSRYMELLKERGLNTVEDVLEFQHPDIEYVDFGKYAFGKGFLWAIPQKPGVYTMKDKQGEIIYVGKAKNLRSRVSSYFWNTADRLQKITDVLRNVHSIEYEITGSELSAMLLEYRLIRQYQPILNQQLEVHERAARYGNLKNFILILPSLMEESLELFFVKYGLPLERYEVLRDAVNFSEVGKILDEMYYETAGTSACSTSHVKGNGNSPTPSSHPARREKTKGITISPPLGGRGDGEGEKVFSDENIQNDNTLTEIETGEIDLVLSWLETKKDHVNYINVDAVCAKEACLKLMKDYIRDEETLQKKMFRLV